jgi:hypothetical protein
MTPREELEALRAEQSGREAAAAQPNPREELEQLRREQSGRTPGKEAPKAPFYSAATPLIGPAVAAATSPQAVSSAQGMFKGAAANSMDVGRTLLKPVSAMMPDNPYLGREAMGEAKDLSRQYRKEAGGAGVAGGLLADLAATGGTSTLLRSAASRLPQAVQQWGSRYAANAPEWIRGILPAGRAATEGAAAGAYLSPDDPAKGAVHGGVGGAVGQQILSRLVPRVAQPIDMAPGAREAMDAGVPLTAGFASNPNTAIGRGMRWIEESTAAIPFLGAAVKAQREAARRGIRDLPIREAAADLNVAVPAARGANDPRTTTAVLEGVNTNVGNRYDTLLANRSFPLTQRFQNEVNAATANPRLSMTEQDRARARGMVEAHLFDRQIPPGQNVLPPRSELADMFASQSDVRRQGYRARGSEMSSERAYGQALIDASNRVYDSIQRRFPVTGRELNRMREPMHRLMTVENAAGRVPVSGDYSMEQLATAARNSNNDRLLNYAQLMHPLMTKDPGTISNAARAAFVLGAPHLAGGSTLAIPMGAGLLAGFGTRTGQRALTGRTETQLMLSQLLQDPDFVRSLATTGGVAGREAGEELYRRRQ